MTTWKHDEGDLEVSLAREDRENRPTMITVRDASMDTAIVMQPFEARWLIDRLEDAIAAAAEHNG